MARKPVLEKVASNFTHQPDQTSSLSSEELGRSALDNLSPFLSSSLVCTDTAGYYGFFSSSDFRRSVLLPVVLFFQVVDPSDLQGPLLAVRTICIPEHGSPCT